MENILSHQQLQQLMLNVIYIERKNARSMEKTDIKMSEEIQKMITDYSRNC